MDVANKKYVYVDIRNVVHLPPINLNQNDTNIIEFIITENRIPAVLNDVGRASVNLLRPDGEVVYKDLTIDGNSVIYEMGIDEMKVAGKCKLSISFYGLDNTKLSTRTFNLYLREEII